MANFTFFAETNAAPEAARAQQAAESGAPVIDDAVHAAEASGGLASLGLDVQAFLFQLITFVIVFLILRQFVLKKVLASLDARRKAVEDSLEHAAQTEKKLKNVEGEITAMLGEARKQADDIIAASHKEAASSIEAAEAKATKRAEQIIAEAKAQMDNEVTKARADLKAETAKLVAVATQKIIGHKLDAKTDAELITKALKEEA